MGFTSITSTHLFKFFFFIFLLFQQSFVASSVQFISNHTVIFEDDTPRFLTYGSPVSIFPFFEGLSIKNSAKAITLKIWMLHNCTGDVKILLYNPIRDVRIISQYRGGNKANVFNGTIFVPTGYLSPDPPLVSTYVFATDDVVPSFRPESFPVFSSLATSNPNGEWEIYFEDSAEGFDGYINKVVLTIQGGCLIEDPCGIGTCSSSGSSALDWKCNCPFGYAGIPCADIDECELGTHNCPANSFCVNTIGSRTCECNPGFYRPYSLCQDINECALLICHQRATCINTPGSFNCTCNKGFVGNGTFCEDINECALGAEGCSINSTCINTPGSYSCYCPSGLSDIDGLCTGTNECLGQLGGHNCSEDAYCTDKSNGFTCNCNPGFFGDGVNCTDINECQGLNGCHQNAICINIPGSYACYCNEGHFGSGFSCTKTQVPVITAISTTTISISWEKYFSSTYQVALVDANGYLEFRQNLSNTMNYTYTNLTPNTQYKMRLTTFSISTPFSDFRDIISTTHPASVSGIEIEQLTSHSVTFTMFPSLGAISYTAQFMDYHSYGLRTINLEVIEFYSTDDELKLRTSIDELTDYYNSYHVQIFADPGNVGVSFNFRIYPPAPEVSFYKIDSYSIYVYWSSSYASRYKVIVTYLNGTAFETFETPINSKAFQGLDPGEYIITVYSGNSEGFNLLEGTTIIASTNKVQCYSTFEGKAYWPPILSGERTVGICDDGYGGAPTRTCLDQGGSGVLSPLEYECIKIPDPISNINVTTKSDSAILSWVVPTWATHYRVYLVFSGQLLPINDGAGLNFSTNEVTVHSLKEWTNYTIRAYAGNRGGFEIIGKTVQFQTTISPPSNFQASMSTTWIYLTWDTMSLAKIYILTLQTENKRSETELSRQNTTNFNFTSLEPSTEYTFTIYSENDDVREQYGSTIKVKTLSPINNQEDNEPNETNVGNLIGIIIGTIGGILVLVLLIIIGIVMYRKYRTTKKHIGELELSETGSKRHNLPASTLVNTNLAIAIPGFLLLDFEKQVRKEGKLGSGGAGCVYSGVLIDSDLISQHQTKKIALKHVPRSPNYTEQELKDLFLQEVSLMWSCSFHQNVIKLIGYVLEPERYIVTKQYELDLLHFILHPTEELSPLLDLKLTNDIASGMASIQGLGIIHHDLKSANVLLEQVEISPGQYILNAIICDFGLARISDTTIVLENYKTFEKNGLSPRYAAPEVFSQVRTGVFSHENQNKVDIYSLGIIIWEMLTRTIVWKGLSNDEIEFQVMKGNRPLLPIVEDNQATIVLIELMKLCWSQEPSQRPLFKEITMKLSPLLEE